MEMGCDGCELPWRWAVMDARWAVVDVSCHGDEL